jgi:enamine deaminase RidA (YjgF/YER057c/UK114 family)
MSSPHELIVPQGMAPAAGYSHAVVSTRGRSVYLAGQAAHDADGSLRGSTMTEQFDAACGNVVGALSAAGAEPGHLVSLHIFVTDVAAYRNESKAIGAAYRRHFGRHFPAMALFGVTELFDPGALVELIGVAVVPD